ncbi:hypothetical protein J2T12_003279 [Paenibacillus anaericanus]|uniref:S-layer homology domain-containing protein n=1 Tax=Paenibacillus anaericanus TaxID=170367 RepID=UPI002788589E|nr:S-layer homology domain-containing protein [Paenibacillus anaericanus]MDQ0089866.1 hypothetical protein [Paenibacillus anaericanus]
MKKILSVALSTAMAFSMFASVAFGADAKLSPEQQFNVLKDAGIVTGYPDGTAGLDKSITRAELAKVIVKSINLEPITGVATYKDKNYTASHWAAPFIEAATQAGILEGKNLEKKLFDPTGNVTVQELAKVLVAALKLEVPAETNNTATEWAKGYVEAAVKAGYLEAGINYQANATRAQAVVASYAIYEANQVPTVASYTVSESGKVVEFTLSNKEVVKVTLEKALEANKETEVKFAHNGHDYTHKVTYVTTVAQKVDSVKADSLKQIVVAFDGSVDAQTAGNEDNYIIKDKTFRSATLSEDKKSVTLLIEEDSASLINQRETELEIKNVKNEDGTKTFNQNVKFTPLDVTAPTVKEVTSLGTKAFKIKFSEPISAANATVSSNYRIDGKAIGASVKFAFPDTVIVQTALTEGEHNVTVANVYDFAGLSVAAVNNTFTVAADTAAPEVVSAKSKDLKEVTVEFNETIKSVSEAYANSSSNKASKIKIEDNKVILTFKDAINYSENTITLKGVSDYSDNKADRDVKVNPTLDTVRPTVSDVEVKINEEGHYIAKVRFSEKLHGDSLNRDNFVLKNSEGKIADVSGVNSNGNPHLKPAFENTEKANVILVDLGFGLKSEKYTLTVSNVKDIAAVPNLIIPVSVDLDVTKVQNGEINRVWTEVSNGERYVFIEFNKSLNTNGEGSALDPAKYTLLKNGNGVGQLTDKSLDVEMLTSKTVRIRTDKKVKPEGSETDVYSVKASYIKNAEGDYLKQGNSYDLVKDINAVNAVKIKLDSIKAISSTEIKVEFDSAITNLVDSDFNINGHSVSGSLAGDGKSATFKVDGDHKFSADATNAFLYTKSSMSSQNEYGTKVSPLDVNGVKASDEVKPEINTDSMKIKALSATTATYNISFELTEAIVLNDRYSDISVAFDAFEVKAEQGNNKYDGKVTAIDYSTGKLVLTVEFKKDSNAVANLGSNAAIVVKLKDQNESAKYLVDTTGNKNALKATSVSNVYNYIPQITP